MKPRINTNGHRGYAPKMTSAEFIDAELYQVALRGGYSREFEATRQRLDCLKPFKTAKEFMKAAWRSKPLREKVVKELEELWKADYDLRPSSGVALMLAMRHSNIMAGDDFWGDYFIGLAEGGE